MSRTRKPKSEVVSPEPAPATPAEAPLKWEAPTLETNLVVQCINGNQRGLLGIIGEINGDHLRIYYPMPEKSWIGNATVHKSDIAVIGRAKVASRNPFQPRPQQPSLRHDPEDPTQ